MHTSTAEEEVDPGGDDPTTLTSMNNLAETYGAQGRTAEAAALHEQALQKRTRILGTDHPATLTSMNNLALTYWAQGRTAEDLARQGIRGGWSWNKEGREATAAWLEEREKQGGHA